MVVWRECKVVFWFLCVSEWIHVSCDKSNQNTVKYSTIANVLEAKCLEELQQDLIRKFRAAEKEERSSGAPLSIEPD